MKENNQIITLYSKENCRLCADIRVFLQARIPSNIEIDEIDISTNSELLDKFEQIIPVIKSKDNNYLYYPFSNKDFEDFIVCYLK